MKNISIIFSTSLLQAIRELKANKLRSALSLTGITIGILSIIAVFTALDSMKSNIKKEVSTLGNNVLYVGRWPWMDEGGEYKWWDFWQRPSMSITDLKEVQNNVSIAKEVVLFLGINGKSIKFRDNENTGFTAYAVTSGFEKLQNIDVANGRYFNVMEIEGGSSEIVIGAELCKYLIPTSLDPIGKIIQFMGKQYTIIGVLKKTGQNIAGMDFDNGIILPFNNAARIIDVKSLNNDPNLIIQAKDGVSIDELQYEVEGVLRTSRKVKPSTPNNFAINKLDAITKRMDEMFASINMIGGFIGVISLIVGAFGIANIMFVSVKERTKFIGLKKAIGAQKYYILLEFILEAVVLCLIGGIIGILFVAIIAMVVNSFSEFHVTLSAENIFIGIFTSIIVGILAGFFPAQKAANLDPVVAIRTI